MISLALLASIVPERIICRPAIVLDVVVAVKTNATTSFLAREADTRDMQSPKRHGSSIRDTASDQTPNGASEVRPVSFDDTVKLRTYGHEKASYIMDSRDTLHKTNAKAAPTEYMPGTYIETRAGPRPKYDTEHMTLTEEGIAFRKDQQEGWEKFMREVFPPENILVNAFKFFVLMWLWYLGAQKIWSWLPF